MKFSTATSVLVNYPLEDALKTVIELGFDGVDIWCGRPHLFRQDYSEDTIKAIGEKLKKSGITVVSVMPAFFRYPFSLSSPVESIRLDSIAYMEDCIRNAALVGAKSVLVVPSSCLSGQSVQAASAAFSKSLAAVCECAMRHGVALGVEVLNPKLSAYACNVAQVMDLISGLDGDSVGLVLDTGHINLSGQSFERELERAGDKLMQIHINDNDGQEQQNAVPGDGNFNFGAMHHLLKKLGYNGFLSLELGWNYSLDPVAALRRSLKASREFFGVQKEVNASGC